MLTMHYDPEREIMWVFQDWRAPFLVTLGTIEELASCRGLSEDQLVDTCREHEAGIISIVARKRKGGEIGPDGIVVITSTDLVNA